jgi:hypothetical protein
MDGTGSGWCLVAGSGIGVLLPESYKPTCLLGLG